MASPYPILRTQAMDSSLTNKILCTGPPAPEPWVPGRLCILGHLAPQSAFKCSAQTPTNRGADANKHTPECHSYTS